MLLILQLLAFGVFVLIALNIWTAMRRGGAREKEGAGPTIIEGRAEEVPTPSAHAASLMREFEHVRSELKGRYPAVFAMLGGYLNGHSIANAGGLESAVREMIADWTPRREEAMRELTKLLAENETEEEVRAIVTAACDADFDREGYRAWLTWLLGRLNAGFGGG